ncbi:MAG: HNH endonuclease, partial [Proteobacteria bacterium]|nr:HNH endonuclease [Pseudomonadota bacterium]
KLQQERRNRIVRLGRLYKNIRDNYWVWTMGFDTHDELARHLSLSLRSLQRYAYLVTSFSMYPEMEAAFRQGMDLTRLEVIASIIDEASAARCWLEVSKHVTVTELRRAVKWAVDEGSELVLQKYESAFAEAQETVALRESQDKGDRPQVVYSHPDQLAAATWFVREVQLPPRRGFQKVIERDNHRCQNPRCEAQHLRVQAHHIKWVSHGGGDEPQNGIPLCTSCHLRLVHAKKASVSRQGNRLKWSFADGTRVTVFE